MTTLAVRDFERVAKLGEGTFGVVYKAIQRDTGNIVALKKIKLEHEDNGVPSTSLREIAVLKELCHPNIVQLYGIICQDSDNLQLVFEYLDFDLRKFMERNSAGLAPEIIQSYLYQLVNGIDFCHARRIIHRDLKPQNLLIDDAGNLKIADFGLARCFGIPMRAYTHEVVTLWYRAPEILLGSAVYGVGVDMWSIGCIFAEMARSAPFFTGDSEIDQIFKTFEKLGTPDEAVWPGVSDLPDWKPYFPQWQGHSTAALVPKLNGAGVDLLERFLVYFPGKRISAKAALMHPYFDEIRPYLQSDANAAMNRQHR